MDLSGIDTGTYDSRKFVLTIVGTALITAYSVAAAWVPAMAGILPAFIGGLMGILGLYFGVNVANKLVMGNIATKQLALNTPPTKAPDNSPISIKDTEGEV